MIARGFASRSLATRALLAPLSGALLLCLTFAGCADDDGGKVHGAVHGTVRDAMTGKQLKGVDVLFVADTLEEASDTTDGDGKYVINVSAATPSGRLTASKSGYETRTVSVYLDDSDVTVDIELDQD